MSNFTQSSQPTPSGSTHHHVPTSVSGGPPGSVGSLIPGTGANVRTAEEEALRNYTAGRTTSALTGDHYNALFPEVDRPFASPIDALQRLLPYHIFQIPHEDLDPKGKGKADHGDEETKETEFAIECFSRYRALEERFRQTRVKSAQKTAPDDQTYVNTVLALESDRAELTRVTNELTGARAELARVKPVAAPPTKPQPPPQASAPTPTLQAYYPQQYYHQASMYYHPYYGYAQHPAGAAPMQPTAPTVPAVPQQPVTIAFPAASLPMFHQYGIYPVQLADAPPPPQPQPPVIIRSTNGATVTLSLNVSLLLPHQMTGLATVLGALNNAKQVHTTTNNPTGPARVP